MLIDVVRKEVPYLPYINTGTLFDLYTGKYVFGTDRKWILDGGISSCLGISGRSQTYKSGIAGSLLARAMAIHKEANAYVYESEGTVAGPERYDDFVPTDQAVSDRIAFLNNTTGNLTDFYEDFMKLVENKEKNKKDYMVESPFINPKTNKPYKIWIPTFVLIDSFSRARSDKGDSQFENNSIDDSGMNTFWLSEGNIKTRIMNDLPGRASKVGIYTILTAHVGNKQDLDPYNKSPKQLQYMKNTDKMKNVGSNFEFLTTTLLQTLKANVLLASDKTCMYPCKYSTDVEVNQVDTMMVRCKNNVSGIQFPFILSQYQGILDSVNNLQFLRDNKNFGLHVKGNNQGFASSLVPDKTMSRTNVRDLTDSDYAVKRGLEIIAQLCFVQKLWSAWKMPDYINIDPMQLAELLTKTDKPAIDRILQSTGVWSTSKQDRERLSLLDILTIANSYKK